MSRQRVSGIDGAEKVREEKLIVTPFRLAKRFLWEERKDWDGR